MSHTKSYLSVSDLSFVLPDGRLLFSRIHATFSGEFVGLVGQNGIGKSVLGQILAGRLAPSSGSVTSTGSIGYLPQPLDWPEG